MRGPRQGAVVRDQALAIALKRKEEYLGARVPRELKDKVIERADQLGIPVSILIRNVLEEVFRDDGTNPLGQPKLSVDMGADTRNAAAANQFPTVLGWEAIKLNRAVVCSSCNARLQAGAYVTLGFGSPGQEHIILCDVCKESI
ncbi:MAG: hypothetical protein AABZ84_02045 [Pseudomonadota bacterium]